MATGTCIYFMSDSCHREQVTSQGSISPTVPGCLTRPLALSRFKNKSFDSKYVIFTIAWCPYRFILSFKNMVTIQDIELPTMKGRIFAHFWISLWWSQRRKYSIIFLTARWADKIQQKGFKYQSTGGIHRYRVIFEYQMRKQAYLPLTVLKWLLTPMPLTF